jgi:hypothetical protein
MISKRSLELFFVISLIVMPLPAAADFINPTLGGQSNISFWAVAFFSPAVLLCLAGIWAVIIHRKK